MTSAGIYIHIPFCRSRCSYCDFATGMYEGALAERYVAAVASEIANWREVEGQVAGRYDLLRRRHSVVADPGAG